MTMMAFHTLFPEEARNENRAITMLGHEVLPDRTLLFVESYCVEHACDCRRVMIHVIDTDRREQVATINHGFEPPKPPFEDEGQTFLDPLNLQSPLSGALHRLFEGRSVRTRATVAAWNGITQCGSGERPLPPRAGQDPELDAGLRDPAETRAGAPGGTWRGGERPVSLR